MDTAFAAAGPEPERTPVPAGAPSAAIVTSRPLAAARAGPIVDRPALTSPFHDAPSGRISRSTRPDAGPEPTTAVTSLGAGASRINLDAGDGRVGSVEARSLEGGATHLSNLSVDAASRGNGFGARLLGAAAEVAGHNGDDVVALGSGDSGSGRLDSWYRSFGFRQHGETAQGAPSLEVATSSLRSTTAAPTRIRRRPVQHSPSPTHVVGRRIQRMEAPDPVPQVVANDAGNSDAAMYDTLLAQRAASWIQFDRARLKKCKNVPDAIVAGKNFQVSQLTATLKEVLQRGDDLADYVLELVCGGMSQADLFTLMERSHRFGTNRQLAEQRLMGSSLLRGGEGGDEHRDAATLSAENVKRLGSDIDELRGQTSKEKGGDRFLTGLDKFMEIVRANYASPVVAHASKSDITGSINSTANRERLQTFSQEATGSHESKKLTNTSPTNTKTFDSHELVYLNMYPQMSDPSHRKAVLGSTRFLKEDYANENSARSSSARSYLYDPGDLEQNDRLMVTTLRDPVHPSGGLVDDQRKARVGNNPHTSFVSASEGQYRYRVGDGDRQQTFDYRTRENFFAGGDIPVGLTRNVERGLLRIFLCSSADNRGKLFRQLLEALNARVDNGDQDRLVMAIIKWFQYPQLMVSGSISIEMAKEIVKY